MICGANNMLQYSCRSSILKPLTSNYCLLRIELIQRNLSPPYRIRVASQYPNNISNKRNYSDTKMESGNKRRIAVCQMTSTNDRQRNMSVVSGLVENACKENVQMIFFPEACDFLCESKKEMLEYSAPIVGGSIVNQYRELAKKHNVWLSMGGIHEKDASADNKMFNTHIVISSDGHIVQSYRKLHLFDVDIPEKGVRLKESDLVSCGNHFVRPFETPAGSLGLGVCYDLRFPEMSAQLAALGADVLTFPSAFTYVTGKAHWEILLRCRAIENQCFVIAAAQVGQHNTKRKSWGHAMAISPWGEILATCGSDDSQPVFAVAEFDYNQLKEVRRNMPVSQHKRDDIYKIFSYGVRQHQIPEHVTLETGENVSEVEKVQSRTEDSSDSEAYYNFAQHKIRMSNIFYETELTYAFVNIRCVVPGHVLIAPKRIAKRTEDLTLEETNDFFQVTIKVQKVMERVFKAKSSTVTIQDGPEAGQTVEHVHCHVMPRHKGDFKDVDLIYLELAKHDARPGHGTAVLKPPRSNQQMKEEADMLREHFL